MSFNNADHLHTDKERADFWKSCNRLVFHDIYRFKIEPTLGCNRSCSFCGMTRKEKHLMTMDTFKAIMNQFVDSIKRVEFILHGEPTLNPLLPEFISMVRKRSSITQIAIATNGYRFLDSEYDPSYLFDLYERGADVVQLSIYNKKILEGFKKLATEEKQTFLNMDVKLKDFYKTRDVFHKFKGLKKEFSWVDETGTINKGKSLQRRFHTFGGNIPENLWEKYSEKNLTLKDFPMTGKGKTCASLLKYIPIGAKGDIYLCCRDAAHSMNLGNVYDTDLTEWWRSKKVHTVRYALKAARRDLFSPCFLCSRYSYRDPLYAYWGPKITKEECIDTIHSMTELKDDVLLDNLIKYEDSYPDKIPNHIHQEIADAKIKYKRDLI